MVPWALAQGGLLKGSMALACGLEQKDPTKKDWLVPRLWLSLTLAK